MARPGMQLTHACPAPPGAAIILGLVYLNQGDLTDGDVSISTVQNIMCVWGTFGSTAAQPCHGGERGACCAEARRHLGGGGRMHPEPAALPLPLQGPDLHADHLPGHVQLVSCCTGLGDGAAAPHMPWFCFWLCRRHAHIAARPGAPPCRSMTVQPVMGAERTVFYRERAASYYSAAPYTMVGLAAGKAGGNLGTQPGRDTCSAPERPPPSVLP